MSKELEQKAREIADRRCGLCGAAGSLQGQRELMARKWMVVYESALEALQLNQKEDEIAMEVSTVDGVYKLNHEQAEQYFLKLNEKIKEQAATIASLQERIKELEQGNELLKIQHGKLSDLRITEMEKNLNLQERCERLEKYAKHDRLCGMVGGYNQCTCGLEQALTETKGGAQSATGGGEV